RPQRCTHFTMFCAALTAPVTRCTFASSRTPDMPTGSRMPSCASMMNSCGSTCRMRWSAGIATARAASITRSTSPGVTSLSRIATMPCEFRLRTWLPAMPVYTLLISQPAISSASSTARWIDCTVDSMFTTTPRFKPRDGDEPKPMTSIFPSGDSSPTIATTFDVPTSRPTRSLRSSRLATARALLAGVRGLAHRELAAGTRLGLVARPLAPADREAVRVAQVDVANPVQLARERGCRDVEEALDPLVDVAPSEAHLLAGRKHEPPRAALVEIERVDRQVRVDEPLAQREVEPRDLALAAVRAGQPRQLREAVLRALGEQLAARVQEPFVAPAGRRAMLGDAHDEGVGPRAPELRRIDPRERFEPGAQRGEIERPEPGLELRGDRGLDLNRRHALERAFDHDAADRPIEHLVEHVRRGRDRAAGEHWP